ncbi:hypothetical protein GWI33_019415 [Rhynchophorus ferrugineus]|uniref:Uncharacterized protein n=1 Tax=Rhynchophorus ferrugineus TaxID=354439 RepID=A0A834I5D8_RHYFE|nr:hypothetical protein GWI33_019415 [Rhynchophorus ferrugineus]
MYSAPPSAALSPPAGLGPRPAKRNNSARRTKTQRTITDKSTSAGTRCSVGALRSPLNFFSGDLCAACVAITIIRFLKMTETDCSIGRLVCVATVRARAPST